jgi:hypothetical protein
MGWWKVESGAFSAGLRERLPVREAEFGQLRLLFLGSHHLHLQICDENVPPSCRICVDLQGECFLEHMVSTTTTSKETAADHTPCLRYITNQKLGFEEEKRQLRE